MPSGWVVTPRLLVRIVLFMSGKRAPARACGVGVASGRSLGAAADHVPAATLGLADDRLENAKRAAKPSARDVHVRDPGAGARLKATGFIRFNAGEGVSRGGDARVGTPQSIGHWDRGGSHGGILSRHSRLPRTSLKRSLEVDEEPVDLRWW